MPPSGNILPPSGRIICGTKRQSHSKPTTTRKLVEEKESVQSFADDAVSYFVSRCVRQLLRQPFTPTDFITNKLHELRNSPRGSVLNKLIQTFLVTSPHSILTERAVKCHTQLKTDLRSNMTRKTVNSRMCIALNSSGAANFDRRPGQQSPGF